MVKSVPVKAAAAVPSSSQTVVGKIALSKGMFLARMKRLQSQAIAASKAAPHARSLNRMSGPSKQITKPNDSKENIDPNNKRPVVSQSFMSGRSSLLNRFRQDIKKSVTSRAITNVKARVPISKPRAITKTESNVSRESNKENTSRVQVSSVKVMVSRRVSSMPTLGIKRTSNGIKKDMRPLVNKNKVVGAAAKPSQLSGGNKDMVDNLMEIVEGVGSRMEHVNEGLNRYALDEFELHQEIGKEDNVLAQFYSDSKLSADESMKPEEIALAGGKIVDEKEKTPVLRDITNIICETENLISAGQSINQSKGTTKENNKSPPASYVSEFKYSSLKSKRPPQYTEKLRFYCSREGRFRYFDCFLDRDLGMYVEDSEMVIHHNVDNDCSTDNDQILMAIKNLHGSLRTANKDEKLKRYTY